MGLIYNSRNYKGVLIEFYSDSKDTIYNSRNYKGVLIGRAADFSEGSTTVEIIREY